MNKLVPYDLLRNQVTGEIGGKPVRRNFSYKLDTPDKTLHALGEVALDRSFGLHERILISVCCIR